MSDENKKDINDRVDCFSIEDQKEKSHTQRYREVNEKIEKDMIEHEKQSNEKLLRMLEDESISISKRNSLRRIINATNRANAVINYCNEEERKRRERKENSPFNQIRKIFKGN